MTTGEERRGKKKIEKEETSPRIILYREAAYRWPSDSKSLAL